MIRDKLWRFVGGMAMIVLMAGAAFGAKPAAAQQRVDLELVLAVDVSASVNTAEYELQMHGIAAAFRDAEVVSAILSSGGLGIAVSVVQWADQGEQEVSVDWTLVYDAASAARLAEVIWNLPRSAVRGLTGIGNLIQFGHILLHANRFDGYRKVIDISGDGVANIGVRPALARELAVADGITINGLAILNEQPNLDRYYERGVIGGPDAFVIPARDYTAFADAIVEKLIREINVPLAAAPSPRSASFAIVLFGL